jgi:hypothetical protein
VGLSHSPRVSKTSDSHPPPGGPREVKIYIYIYIYKYTKPDDDQKCGIPLGDWRNPILMLSEEIAINHAKSARMVL